jgi:uncharacterized protein (TIGR02246 family)
MEDIMRLVRRFIALFAAAAAISTCGAAIAEDEAEAAARKAIDAATRKFVEAFNVGDTKVMLSLWTEDGDYIGENGERTRFRDRLAVADANKQTGKEKDKSHPSLVMLIDSVRLVTPQVATVDGTSVYKSSGDAPAVHGRYAATWVLRGEQWLLDSVRENHVPAGLHHAHLMELEWMLGEWTVDAKDSPLETRVRWSADGNYLEREFKSQLPGRGDHSGVQRIGWDPKREQFRSWTFADDGSFSHGLWTATENGWTIEISGVTTDGKSTGSVTRITKIDDNALEWESVEATIEGQPLPDLKLRLIRKAKK